MNREEGPNVHKMNLYFQLIIPVLRDLHGIDDAKFWKMVLYWYVTDRIKSKGCLDGTYVVPYDHVVHKEMFRGGRKKRSNRSAVDSIIDIAKILYKKQRYKFPAAVVYYTVKYIVFKCTNGKKGRGKRETLEAISDGQMDRSLKFALLHVPTVLIEDFDFFVSLKIDFEEPIDTRKVKNGFAVAYASRKLKGRKTRLMQHGARYGEIRDHAGTCIESRLPDEYFTWGWKYHENHVPARAYRLERFSREYRRYSKEMVKNRILVAIPVNSKDGFNETFSRFLSLLRERRLTDSWQFTIRKKPKKSITGNQGDKAGETEKSIGPEFFMDEGEAAPRAIAGARLVVSLDHPATMFLEAIYVDKPTVAIANELGEYRQEYLPHVRFLLESGILHETVESLVGHLNSMVEGPEKWWDEVKSSEGYAKYKSTYCGWDQKRSAGQF